MRLSTICVSGELRPALWVGNELLDLRAASRHEPRLAAYGASVRSILALDDQNRADLARIVGDGTGLRGADAWLAADSTTFAPVIPDPGIILAAGLNYHSHVNEMSSRSAAPTVPYAFAKFTGALIGANQPIMLPAEHAAMVDWEGEFCAVIGRPCHQVIERDALRYVGGYTLINDVSARDWVAGVSAASGSMGAVYAWEQNLLGKQFPTFCPAGPAIATADEIPNPRDVRLQTKLNGTVMQDAHTSDLIFGVAEMIGYYSRFYAFRPGDIISTGSPAGVGMGRKPPVFMRAGDTIEVESPVIGCLRNPV